MAMLEIRNVQKTFRTYAKPGLFHRPGARKVISDLPVLQYFLKQKGSSYAKAVGTPKKGDFYGIAAPKDKKDLVDGMNKALKELKDSGEYKKIYTKWFGEMK